MATKLHLDGGEPPLMPTLAEVMPAGPALIDQLASEYTETVTLSTPQAYWTGLNGWATDRLSGPIMEGKVSADEIGEQAWVVYATSCWGGMELRENWGMPNVIASMGEHAPKPPFADVQQGIIPLMTQRMEAIRGGGDACMEILPSVLQEATTTGFIHNLGYNSGVQVVKTEDPPIGQRRPHRPVKPAIVRINGRDFLRVDYEMPTPPYLRTWRSAFERAVTANPEAYDRILGGSGSGPDLREIWRNSVAFGNQTWGGDSQDMWTETYWDETIRWSSTVSFGLEAAAMAAIVALLTGDTEAATHAVMCNAMYLGASAGWFIGLLSAEANLPTIVEA